MVTGEQLKAAILARRAGRGRARNTPGRSLGSTPLPTWSAHETGWGGGASNSTTTSEAVPTGDTRGWSGRSSNCLTSSRNYACAASSATMTTMRGKLVPAIKLMWLLPAGGRPSRQSGGWITRAGRRRCKSARGPKADRCSQSHFGRARRRKNLFNYATYI